MTRTQLTTDADGDVRFRGFYGDYALRYELAGEMKTVVRFSVNKQQAMPLTIVEPLAWKG